MTGKSTPAVGDRHPLPHPTEPPAIGIVCHKGANKVAPENTYAAAQQCMDWGAGTVEVDVWTTRDGEMVLMHDATVERTTDGAGHVVALTSAEIAGLDAGSWFHPQFGGERVPLLREFLSWIKGRSRVFLDVKFAHPQHLLDLLDETGMHDDVFVWSGSGAYMGLLHELDRTLTLKANVSTPEQAIAAQAELGASIVEVELDHMTDRLRRSVDELGLKLMIYEKKPENFRRVIDWKPHLVNVDHADAFLTALSRLAPTGSQAPMYRRTDDTAQ